MSETEVSPPASVASRLGRAAEALVFVGLVLLALFLTACVGPLTGNRYTPAVACDEAGECVVTVKVEPPPISGPAVTPTE